VANSGENTYFKVPYGWHAISATALKSVTGSSGGWTVAYEAGKPAASDFLSFETTQPFVFAEIATLNSTTSSQMSYACCVTPCCPSRPPRGRAHLRKRGTRSPA
jgi:hypothetical protein